MQDISFTQKNMSEKKMSESVDLSIVVVAILQSRFHHCVIM